MHRCGATHNDALRTGNPRPAAALDAPKRTQMQPGCCTDCCTRRPCRLTLGKAARFRSPTHTTTLNEYSSTGGSTDISGLGDGELDDELWIDIPIELPHLRTG